MNKCYSTNEEDFNFTEMDDAAEDAFSESDMGDTAYIWEGIPKRPTTSDFISLYFVEKLGEQAWDDHGEYVDDWPECTSKQSDELISTIKKAVDEWADKHKLQPKFYSVENIKKIKVKLLDTDEFKYEVIDE